MTTRHIARMAAAILLAASTAKAATIFVDAANCRPPASDCCAAHGGPGCDDMSCETAVCAVEPLCCAIWDSFCVSLAETLCDPLCRGECPGGGGTGTELDPFCCIQSAIDIALVGDEVLVAAGTYVELIDYLGKEIAIRSVDGPGVTTITSDANNAIVTCNNTAGPGAVLDGFTIADSPAHGLDIINAVFGPNIENCVFSGNRIGIFVDESVFGPQVNNCTFINNSGPGNSSGAGIRSNQSSPVITNSLFEDNTAQDGGGFWTAGDGPLGNYPELTNCTFLNNTATSGAGVSSSAA